METSRHQQCTCVVPCKIDICIYEKSCDFQQMSLAFYDSKQQTVDRMTSFTDRTLASLLHQSYLCCAGRCGHVPLCRPCVNSTSNSAARNVQCWNHLNRTFSRFYVQDVRCIIIWHVIGYWTSNTYGTVIRPLVKLLWPLVYFYR